MTTCFTPLTQAQFDAALRLARHYGHEWADVWSHHGQIDGADMAANISAAYGAARAAGYFTVSLPAGIESPVWSGDIDDLPLGAEPHPEHGRVGHVTGTGRTAWRVCADGSVSIEIRRPHPVYGPASWQVVLSASTGPSASGYGSPSAKIEAVEAHAPYHARHLAALAHALAALVDTGSIVLALGHLVAGALTD